MFLFILSLVALVVTPSIHVLVGRTYDPHGADDGEEEALNDHPGSVHEVGCWLPPGLLDLGHPQNTLV